MDTDSILSVWKKLIGFKFKAQSDQGFWGDDTAANSINMFCEDGTTLAPSFEGDRGSWGGNKYCLNDQVICGMQAQIEYADWLSDDSALNNVKFYCCSL